MINYWIKLRELKRLLKTNNPFGSKIVKAIREFERQTGYPCPFIEWEMLKAC
jgi:hypothetical protein